MIQPIAAKRMVRPNHVSKRVLRETLNSWARMPARMMPSIKPVVVPIRHPGWARLRPRSFFIMDVLIFLFVTVFVSDDNATLSKSQVSKIFIRYI